MKKEGRDLLYLQRYYKSTEICAKKLNVTLQQTQGHGVKWKGRPGDDKKTI